MSGHSKWHNIKLKKGKVDAQRGALFTKLSKEIILAAKGGSPDPEANYRLKMAVEKAREFNMPHDNIKRAIARGAGQTGEREIEEIRYEGYGPHGLAVVVDAATTEPPVSCGFSSPSTKARSGKPAASAGCSTRSA
jgi:YebC/PmpR family DNA-binding regulatory protein